MRQLLLTILLAGAVLTLSAQSMKSPNGKLTMKQEAGIFVVSCQQQKVMELNLPTATLPSKLKAKRVKADYQMLAGKRLHCTNQANEYRLGTVTVRLYNDGVAFRYEAPSREAFLAANQQGEFAYRIPEGTKRWMQQWSDGYEGFFPLTTTANVRPVRGFGNPTLTADGYNKHWGYPLLVEPADGLFALITEANIERGQSASSLFNDGELFRVVPDEMLPDSGTTSCVTAHSPWRVVIIGTLADVVQSTLVTDVSEPSTLSDVSWIHPGVVSWVYWAYNHGSNDYNIIKMYVDMAVTLRLPYVLIDAEWDEMKDGKTIEEAVAYAVGKGIKPLIWYNSSVGWVNGAPGPKYRLNDPDKREQEFAWCERIGVAGVKIDFFSGDNQMNMEYCMDLLESAARHHLLVNFHGAPIPRGWQRTYPNLLSTEGVYGAEWYNNVPTFTNRAAAHNATLPFTRNVIGPMDYTPCAFSDSQHPHITTHSHELALTVLYESGLQHLADRPESFLAQPQQVKDFLGQLPTAWDETRLVTGYPANHVVMARRKGNVWWVAGINGTDQEQTLQIDLSFVKSKGKSMQLFADSGNADRPWSISEPETLPTSIRLLPRGGFVLLVGDKL